MRNLLVHHYGFPAENVQMLLDREATKASILQALTELADKCARDDRVLVYFSGHGHTLALPKGGQRGYLVPSDVKLKAGEVRMPGRVEQDCVPMTELRQKATLLAARHTLFLMDACYSGLAIEGKGLTDDLAQVHLPPYLKASALRPVLGILTAGAAGEEAAEDPEIGHGYFTRKLLDALEPVEGTILADTAPAREPDGIVTLAELAAYLKTEVPRASKGRQNPQEGRENEGQFLFIPRVPVPKPPPRPEIPPEPQVLPESKVRVPIGFRALTGVGAEPHSNTGLPKEIVHERTGIEMVFIPAGTFQMGSAQSERDSLPGEHPRDFVRVAKPFYMSKCEVTQAQWQSVMGTNPSTFRGGDRLPVENVSWNDCQAFIERAGGKMRLPTEAEWEYACRAGSTTRFSFGDDDAYLADYAWYVRNSNYRTHEVGLKKPNAFGLYDMHGNVWEWCQSLHKAYPYRQDDGREDLRSSGVRSLRGGSWGDSPGDCRSAVRYGTDRGANRYGHDPSHRDRGFGFRLIREID